MCIFLLISNVTHIDLFLEVHIPDVFEEVIAQVDSITLTSREYCVILDPVGESNVTYN